MVWLKIEYNESDIVSWLEKPHNKIHVAIDSGKTIPITNDNRNIRVSPIFPLCAENNLGSIENSEIYFFSFSNAYRVLGRVDKVGSDNLKNSIFFSLGLASIILITANEELITEFRSVITQKENAFEKWTIKQSMIESVEIIFDKKERETVAIEIANYEMLPVTERALIDEFKIAIKLLLLKLTFHMPFEIPKIKRLIEEVNSLVVELVFLSQLEGTPPNTLDEFTTDDLRDKKLNQIIRHQNLDRIIQISSSLSYVSTQAFSGASPLLERRSLIRRNSLLGVGSAILALNRMARFIETAFATVSFEEVISTYMPIAESLHGTDNLPLYDCNDWDLGSVNKLSKTTASDTGYFKLPYFSGRLGFRETEYSIAAAIQSITSGASLEWSLMTLTHEMLHGHVREIITLIFCGENNLKPEEQRSVFYKNFSNKLDKKQNNEKLIDSIRNIFLCYCCFTQTHGSLTAKLPYKSNKFVINLPSQDELWDIFENENRNISELFVHILDLNYFYASRVSVYIPLIWCSWLSVPHINGDIRQYILRSLLTISSKIQGNDFDRFDKSISRFCM